VDRTRLWWAVLGLGVVLVALSVFADQIGLGSDNGLGWKQVVGIVVGGIVAALGAARLFFMRSANEPAGIGAEKTG
jgi:uncharacterized membrane protein